MEVWRICRKSQQTLDGEGAGLHGGRWNSAGVPVVYASSTLALAALEYLVHVDIEDVPPDLVAMRIALPKQVVTTVITRDDLPGDWQRIPDHPVCVSLGDNWVRTGTTLALQVPSAVVPEEANLLINPAHPQSHNLVVRSVRPFAFDPRLL